MIKIGPHCESDVLNNSGNANTPHHLFCKEVRIELKGVCKIVAIQNTTIIKQIHHIDDE